LIGLNCNNTYHSSEIVTKKIRVEVDPINSKVKIVKKFVTCDARPRRRGESDLGLSREICS